MNINDLYENSRGRLYRGCKMRNAVMELENNQLDGHTYHRAWTDGKPRRENDPGYAPFDERDPNKLIMLKGISTSRSPQIARSFGPVVYIFDWEKLAKRYKIIPYAWHYQWEEVDARKVEQEEFIVLGKGYQDKHTLDNLNYYLIGIELDASQVRRQKVLGVGTPGFKRQIKYIINHPKYLGTFDIGIR